MATPICNARVRNVLTAVVSSAVLALGVSALVAPDLSAQESRRPGGGEGRQFDGAGRGAGGARVEGGRPTSERAGGEGRRPAGETQEQGSSDSAQSAAPMPFDAAPVRNAQAASVAPVVAQVPQQNGWLNEIAELEARLALIEKRNELDERMIDSQLKLMEKRAELDSLARTELDTRLVDSQIQLRTKRSELNTLLRENTDATLAYLPSVVSIIGAKGKYQAQLYFTTGRISYVREGELIAPGVRVTSISPAGIEVSTILGDASQPQQVPLNFVSLPERRGEMDEAAGGDTQQGWVPPWLRAMGMGGSGANAAPRPQAAGAAAAARGAAGVGR